MKLKTVIQYHNGNFKVEQALASLLEKSVFNFSMLPCCLMTNHGHGHDLAQEIYKYFFFTHGQRPCATSVQFVLAAKMQDTDYTTGV